MNDGKDKLWDLRLYQNERKSPRIRQCRRPSSLHLIKLSNLQKRTYNQLATTIILPFSCNCTSSLHLLCHWRKWKALEEYFNSSNSLSLPHVLSFMFSTSPWNAQKNWRSEIATLQLWKCPTTQNIIVLHIGKKTKQCHFVYWDNKKITKQRRFGWGLAQVPLKWLPYIRKAYHYSPLFHSTIMCYTPHICPTYH